MPPVDKSGLLLVAERLRVAAKVVTPRAKSFSYRMIAGVLNKFVDAIIAAEDE